MDVKFMFYGVSSIIGIAVTIAALGSIQQMMSQAMQNIIGTEITNKTSSIMNTYCNQASDCKQNPQDCTRCVNILQGGFTLLNPCNDDARTECQCNNNACAP